MSAPSSAFMNVLLPVLKLPITRTLNWSAFTRSCSRPISFEELPPRAFQFSRLRGRFFFERYEFVTELLRLPFEFRLEPFLPFGVALRPERGVVFDLLLHHRVEDDRDLVGGRRGGPRRS